MSERSFPWRAALFASLAVNLLLLGAVAGGYAAGLRLERPGVSDRMAHRGPPPKGGFLRALPREERAAMRADLRRSWAETRALREKARAAREDVQLAASAEIYDAAAVSAALARMREADAAVQTVWHESMTRSLSRLNADQRRAAIAAFIRERTGPLGRMRHGRGKGGDDDGPPAPGRRTDSE